MNFAYQIIIKFNINFNIVVSDAIQKVNKILDANIEQIQSNLVTNGAATLDFLSTLCFTNGKPICLLQGIPTCIIIQLSVAKFIQPSWACLSICLPIKLCV